MATAPIQQRKVELDHACSLRRHHYHLCLNPTGDFVHVYIMHRGRIAIATNLEATIHHNHATEAKSHMVDEHAHVSVD